MKCGKAAGTTLVIAEMPKSCCDEGVRQICDLIDGIVNLRKIPAGWDESIIVSLYMEKAFPIEWENYRDLNLLDLVTKVLQGIEENFPWLNVYIDDMQFGIMPRGRTINTIYSVCQLQENVHALTKALYMAFFNLESHSIVHPNMSIWWAHHKLNIEWWLVRLIHSMYENATSRVHVGCNQHHEVSVKIGGLRSSCLCVFSLLISIVMLKEYILCLIIIIVKLEVWIITHCLGLGHETNVCTVCLYILISAQLPYHSTEE